MKSPPRKERRLSGTTLRKLQLLGLYHGTAILAKIFAARFWFFEQHRWRFADRIDNERSER
jgi:hypothetical protein